MKNVESRNEDIQHGPEAEQRYPPTVLYDIDGLSGSGKELANVIRILEEISARYGLEPNEEKVKLMAINNMTITDDKAVHGQKLDTCQQFTYFRSHD